MRLAESTIDIEAPRERVWELFTTSEGLQQWMASHATVDLRVGGSWQWVHDDGSTCSGNYEAIEPFDRLVFTYGWESGRFADSVAPGSTRVEVDFEVVGSDPEHTRVSVHHSGLIGELVDAHVAGWTHFTGVLSDVARSASRGDAPGAVLRRPYDPDETHVERPSSGER